MQPYWVRTKLHLAVSYTQLCIIIARAIHCKKNDKTAKKWLRKKANYGAVRQPTSIWGIFWAGRVYEYVEMVRSFQFNQLRASVSVAPISRQVHRLAKQYMKIISCFQIFLLLATWWLLSLLHLLTTISALKLFGCVPKVEEWFRRAKRNPAFRISETEKSLR